MTAKIAVTVRLEEITSIDTVAGMWRALEPCCTISFFQSWGWIGAWLKSLPTDTRLHLIIAETDGELSGLAILAPAKVTRHRLLTSKALFLNEAGLAGYNFVIEHNGFLLRSGREQQALDACLQFLAAEVHGWDEVFISGIRQDSPLFLSEALAEHDIQRRVLKTSSSRYVDLEELRQSGRDYLDTLSSNTRYQVRRALRKHETNGPLTLAVATTLEQAHAYFEEMKVLHQAYWVGKGMRGSFANHHWEAFHRSLMSERFSHGEIQLLRIAAGAQPIGYLYNFIHNGWVYALQSGFHYEQNHTLHPGYVSHYLAIEYNLRHGAKIYDFLAGDAQYKYSLGRNDHALAWVVLQRRRWKFTLEDVLRKTVHRVKSGIARGKTHKARG
jgi:CelD/BcsL family acetyltransferase involved in cellulose biosynthesis